MAREALALLNITPIGRAGFIGLGRLSESSFVALMEALQQPSEEIDGKKFLEKIQQAVAVNTAEARAMYAALQSLDREDNAAIANDIVETLTLSGELVGNGIDAEILRARSARVKLPRQLVAFVKASSLLVRNEHNFISAKSITDLRPVFGDDVDNGPIAYVIEHQLQLRFRKGDDGPYDNFFIAMDESDIDDLIEILHRSKRKTFVLKKELKGNRMPYLTTNRF